MNNDVKKEDSNPVSAPVSGNVIQPQGSLNKERVSVGQNVSEFVRPAGPEISPNVPSEVSKSGVKVPTDKPFLTPEHKEIGLEHSGPAVPVPSGPTGLVKIPDEKDVNNSNTWYNVLTDKVQKATQRAMKLLGV